jgi:hypothetical protein
MDVSQEGTFIKQPWETTLRARQPGKQGHSFPREIGETAGKPKLSVIQEN